MAYSLELEIASRGKIYTWVSGLQFHFVVVYLNCSTMEFDAADSTLIFILLISSDWLLFQLTLTLAMPG